MVFQSHTADDTRSVGAVLSGVAKPGDSYGLIGDLGSGKTEFVRGFVGALNPFAVVRSPSFPIINIYETDSFPVYHFDFYRLKQVDELCEIGFTEYLSGEGVCLIEWADMFPEILPPDLYRIFFAVTGDSERTITVRLGDGGKIYI